MRFVQQTSWDNKPVFRLDLGWFIDLLFIKDLADLLFIKDKDCEANVAKNIKESLSPDF